MPTKAANTMTRPLRVAHLADTHLGYRALTRIDSTTGRNQRALDIESAFETTITHILDQQIDLVLHAGDVFHHTRPSWATLRCFVRQMRRIETAGIPCIVIGGNHDTPRLRTTGSVFSLLELALPGIHFVAGYTEIELAFDALDLRVHAVPHGALTNPNPPTVLADFERRNILITHGLAPGVQLRGGRPHEAGEERLAANLLDPDLDYIALGHYHIWGDQGGKAWYAGSTERMGWGDEPATPGYLLVTLGARGDRPAVERIDIPTRPLKTLHPLAGEGQNARELADRILDRVRALAQPDAMVRVELKETPRPIRREVELLLKREIGDLVWSLQVYSPTDLVAGFEAGGDEALADLRTLFTAFVEEQERKLAYDPVFAARFRERGDQALTEAMRAAEEVAPAEESAA
jgi:DNA repair exonuclease SbcCD nuclease subunit